MIVLKILGYYDGQPTGYDGLYIRTYDPDAYGGRGNVTTTPDPKFAAIFPNTKIAQQFWDMPSSVKPFLEDGTVNAPLTAFSIRLERIERFYYPGEIPEPDGSVEAVLH